MTRKKTSTRVALVTGAGGGIGSVTALEFARHGYRVAVCDIDEASVQATAAAVKKAGGKARAYVTDVADAHSVERLFAAIEKDFGRLDAAFNNAGVGGARTPVAEVKFDDWERILRINLTGTFLCMQQEIRLMLKQGGGAIVNNGSIFALNGGISAPYTATKHGIAGLTKSAALSYAQQGVRVNAVCPGLIEAGMGLKVLKRTSTDPKELIAAHPVNRTGTALEVAHAVLWLCSDQAGFVHGHLLAIDGGYGAR
ncbi:MAG TPA: SDR family oxidoreductase [Nevskiaceae bacterium]|nr:SDR family oxidoreductase [Nevskiaceae bacterium]